MATVAKQKQIFNQNVLLNFSGTVQSIDVQVNVLFNVGKIVFHPPRQAGTDNAADHYLLYSTVNKGGGIVGFVPGTLAGAPDSVPVVVTFENPTSVNGYHKFYIRCLTEAAGGAATALVSKVWQLMEFHEA